MGEAVADTQEIEPLHLQGLNAVARRLRESTGVAALCPEQVFGPDAESLARAGEWGRCVLVTAGRKYGESPGAENLLVQRDARVEMRAESQDVLNMLANAVVKALNGRTDGVVQHYIHSHSGESEDGPNGEGRSRTDKFAMHMVMVKQKGAAAVPPPPKAEPKQPVAAPPKLVKEKKANG